MECVCLIIRPHLVTDEAEGGRTDLKTQWHTFTSLPPSGRARPVRAQGKEGPALPVGGGNWAARHMALWWVLCKDAGLGSGGEGEGHGATSGVHPPHPPRRGPLTQECRGT